MGTVVTRARTQRRTCFTNASVALVRLGLTMLTITGCGAGVRGSLRFERIANSRNFRDGHFVNSVPTVLRQDRGWLSSGWDWFTSDRSQGNAPGVVPTVELPSAEVRTPSPFRAIWLGHATVLLDIDGKRILTDPMFSERCSPVQFAGPVRFHPPPLPVTAIPDIDAVVISHDHYDHLDRASSFVLRTSGGW